jgi:hypothetical protein
LNIVKNDAGVSGRNWQIFDLNIIAHLLATGFLKKVPILKNTALKLDFYRFFSISFRFSLSGEAAQWQAALCGRVVSPAGANFSLSGGAA